jgi:pyridinium-3,5-bisthiocarboxylic acid mononucleotide nickel chelatase
MLRLLVGESPQSTHEERMIMLETNIDDLNPQVYEHLMERLFAAGAMDVYLTPITMKKGRPGILLSLLTEQHLASALSEIVFQETTTLGIRQIDLTRRVVPRASQTVETRFGPVQVKVVTRSGGLQKRLPEYKDCRRIAQETGLPLRQIMDELEETLNPASRGPRPGPSGGSE